MNHFGYTEEEQDLYEAAWAAHEWLEKCHRETEWREAVPKVSEMIQSKFLRKEDFDDDRVVTIKGVKLEEVGKDDDPQQRWVLYFRELEKGMVLNITTIRVLEQAFGDDSDDWKGQQATVYVDPNVAFGGKVVGGLRLRPMKKQAGKTGLRPAVDDEAPAGRFDPDDPGF